MTGFLKRKMKATPTWADGLFSICFHSMNKYLWKKKKSMIWEGNLAKGLAELHFLLNHFSFSYFISCISKKGRELCSAFCYYIKHMGLEVCALIEREVASCLLSVGDKGAFSLCVSF